MKLLVLDYIQLAVTLTRMAGCAYYTAQSFSAPSKRTSTSTSFFSLPSNPLLLVPTTPPPPLLILSTRSPPRTAATAAFLFGARKEVVPPLRRLPPLGWKVVVLRAWALEGCDGVIENNALSWASVSRIRAVI